MALDVMFIGEMEVEILKRIGATTYLGRNITFSSPNQTELDGRIGTAWRQMAVWKQELASKHYSLNSRLRRFSAIIKPIILYGCTT